MVYNLGFSISFISLLTSCLMVLGLGCKYYYARMLGLCCLTFLQCATAGAITTIGLLRFNSVGKYSALSSADTNYVSDYSYSPYNY